MEPIDLAEKFGSFSDCWSPKLVGSVNDYDVKLAKLKGEFVWHKHDETDELLLVVAGALVIELRDRNVPLKAGEIFVVPRGVEHRPVAGEEAHVLLLEPRGTVNTGDPSDPRAVTVEQRI